MTKHFGALIAAIAVISISASPVYAGKDHKEGKNHKMMKKVDVDGDGMISRDEFDAHHTQMFEKLDADGDDNISKEEMKAHKKQKGKGHKDKGEGRKGKGDRDDD